MNATRRSSAACRRGSTMVYGICCMTVLIGMMSFAVDLARVQSAKSELQTVTDAAARYAAIGMRSVAANTSSASANAAAVFAQNKVDGYVAPFNAGTDLELGTWKAGSREFKVTTLDKGANAVRIRTRLTMGDSNRPLTLLSLLSSQVTVTAEAIAMVDGETDDTYVSAKGNPWLSGMPEGTKTTNLRPDNAVVHDYAGKKENDVSSPGVFDLKKAKMLPGQTLTFDAVTGLSGYGGGSSGATNTADGNIGMIVNLGTANGTGASNWPTPVNGISNVRAPINAMMAVFLSDDQPDTSAAPNALDFSTASSREYTSIAPQLKQAFFVGDGRTSSGEAQQIVVPPGATRLFIGNMDAWQWNDNVGGYTATVHSNARVLTVR